MVVCVEKSIRHKDILCTLGLFNNDTSLVPHYIELYLPFDHIKINISKIIDVSPNYNIISYT